MRKLLSILNLVMLWSSLASGAQLRPANETGVTMGHVHLMVRDIEANKKFWSLLGGTPLKIDGTDVMKFPGVLVFLTPGTPLIGNSPPEALQTICGCPPDGLEPGVINHLGFLVKDYDSYIAKFRQAGLTTKAIYRDPRLQGPGRRQVLLFSPDNVALEIAENKSIDFPITQQHFHFFVTGFTPESPHQVPAFSMFAWYVKTFGANPVSLDVGAELPGVNMRFSASPFPTVPIKGRVVDHIGFEVKNLNEFVQKLEASGVKFEKPYSKTRHDGFASAEFTDSWGVSIELTEGLNRF